MLSKLASLQIQRPVAHAHERIVLVELRHRDGTMRPRDRQRAVDALNLGLCCRELPKRLALLSRCFNGLLENLAHRSIGELKGAHGVVGSPVPAIPGEIAALRRVTKVVAVALQYAVSDGDVRRVVPIGEVR
jgi:hypothetical protein